MATTSCAPCIFAPASSNFLSYPSSVEIISVALSTLQITSGNTTTTSTITNFISPTLTPAAGYGATTTYGVGEDITWETLGATLTYPTVYVDYVAFQGAAATGTGCGTDLLPSALTVPAAVPSASLIYAQDNTGQIPPALLAYLDSVPAFITQLNNDPLSSCAAIPGDLLVTGGRASVTTTLTTTKPTTTTSTTTIPPPSTTTITGSTTATVTSVINASNAVTQRPVGSLSAVTGTLLMVSDGQTVSAAPITMAGTSGSSTTSYDTSSMRSALSSKVSVASSMSSGVYTNSTSTIGSTKLPPTVPPSRTASIISYTGAAASQAASMVAGGSLAGLLGLALYL